MSGSTFLLLLRLGVSLAIVMGLIWVAARVLRARGGVMQFRQSGAAIDVVDRRPLGRNSSVALVRVGGRALLLGITDARVQLISEVPSLDESDAAPAVAIDEVSVVPLDGEPHLSVVGARPSFIDALRDATVRRAGTGRAGTGRVGS